MYGRVREVLVLASVDDPSVPTATNRERHRAEEHQRVTLAYSLNELFSLAIQSPADANRRNGEAEL